MGEIKSRSLGSIYTPEDFVKFLTDWAITDPRHKVLDLGVGDGAFVFASYNRLVELGASSENAQLQIYGSEISESAFTKYKASAKNCNVYFPNIHHKDFFDFDCPEMDVVVGNPPYVRRMHLDNIEDIRNKVSAQLAFASDFPLSRLTDLYVYFLLRSFVKLRIGGRIAVITADSWLNVGYGDSLKKQLQQQFQIEALVSLDRRVFINADVKPVLLLATKIQDSNPDGEVSFIRLKNGLPIRSVSDILRSANEVTPNTLVSRVKSGNLRFGSPWGVHFKTPSLYDEITSSPLMTPIANIAQTRVGIQTLAKDFFVLTKEKAQSLKIESDFLAPLAQSPSLLVRPVIEHTLEPDYYLFFCSDGKEDIKETFAYRYIMEGEQTEVPVRGKDTTVIGYQNKDRIKQSSRKYWYDLKSSVDRRGRASILVPRLLYKDFMVVWNAANYVPGELFIEFLPYPLHKIDVEVYLAILSSSVTEIILRSRAQVYGGGTYNINPGQIKKAPMLNVNLIDAKMALLLKESYRQYVLDGDRARIDDIVYDILQFDKEQQREVILVLEDLVGIADASKKHPVSYHQLP